jgi:hypothetical protein
MTELGEVIRDAVQGKAEYDALAAMMTAIRGYVSAHPGRYMATTGAEITGTDDPLQVASARVIDSIAAVLRGYRITEEEMTHAIRTIRSTMHGFAILEASRGFQWNADPDETFEWMIRFIDRGLPSRGSRGRQTSVTRTCATSGAGKSTESGSRRAAVPSCPWARDARPMPTTRVPKWLR